MAPRRVAIVPHTHWDREWHSTYQTFRLRLVDLLDEFLPLMEDDEGYAHFLLDGQMAVVDDYLEVRPEAEDRLRRLAVSGRLAMGPWYVLMDEFLVSGETIVRDLQMGMARADDFAGPMEVGYLPDMFGHVAQMPQLLRLAGLEHAVVWRGVPAAVDRTAFRWSAPDGSTVRAEYLPRGYGNGAAIPDDPEALLRRVRAHEVEIGDLLLDGMLWMNGTDHQTPQPWLGKVVAAANALTDDYRLEVTSLWDHVTSSPDGDHLPSWTGELRSGARANLLMGVASNRVDVHQAAVRVEMALERFAEPLCALHLPDERWPQALLDVAWKEVVRNSAHDSICACSVDGVVDDVLGRFRQAHDIASGLARRAIAHLASTLADEGTVVVNPSARPRSGVVEVVVPGEGPVEGGQVVSERPAALLDETVPGRDLGSVLGRVRSQEIAPDTYVNDVVVTDHGDRVEVRFDIGPRMLDSVDVEAHKRELYALGGSRLDTPFHVEAHQEPSRRALVRVDEVPGYGWKRWEPAPLSVPPVEVGGLRLSNGLLAVEVDEATGTFSIDGRAGLGHLVDDGDAGDTYNYSPPPGDVVVSRPEGVWVDTALDGPVVGRLEVRAAYTWPAGLDGDGRRTGGTATEVVTTLELHAGEPFLRVAHTFENRSCDHRLRAWFPLPERASRSRAECAFAVVERGLTAEGGPHEHGLPTFPSRRFVSAGGLTLVHEGLLEYELVDDGGALALTLLRATGWLSQMHMAYRSLPAGPPIPVEGAQMLGRQTVRYAVHVGDVDPYDLADDAFLFLSPHHAAGGGHAPAEGSALTVEGAQVSALRRRAGRLEVRVFNPTAEPATVRIPGRSGHEVDLRDRPLAPFAGERALRPWEIVTLHLEG